MTTAIAAVRYKRESLERHYSDIVGAIRLFDAEVPDEDCARAKLFAELADNGRITCGDCGLVSSPAMSSERFFLCRGCKRKVWITAHTFFADVRKVRPWLALIWLMERGISFNPYQIHELIHVSSSTAAEMKHKLDYLISGEMPVDSPTVPSAYFTALFCRRTRETPAREHPREEQAEIDRRVNSVSPEDQQAPDIVQQEDCSDPLSGPLNDCEQAVWDCLSEQFISFDRLACRSELPVSMLNAGICLLQLRGVIKTSHGTFARVPKNSMQKVDISKVPAEEFKKFVKTIHQGIGRRTIQWYLASFWCLIDRQRWGPGKLLSVCLKAGPVRLDELRRYVSPPLVKILPQL